MDILEQRGVSLSLSAGWYRDFLNRHPLVQRCARTMEQNRAGASSEAVARYFIQLICMRFHTNQKNQILTGAKTVVTKL